MNFIVFYESIHNGNFSNSCNNEAFERHLNHHLGALGRGYSIANHAPLFHEKGPLLTR